MRGSLFRQRAPRRRDEGEGVLPLINIVFLLLIFFMLAGRIAAPDPFPLMPPVAQAPGPAETGGLIVSVAADGTLALNGQTLPRPDVLQALQQALAAGKMRPVTLRADHAAEAAGVIALLQAIQAAGAKDLHLQTRVGG